MAKATRTKARKKEKKNIASGIVHIQATFNNTIITLRIDGTLHSGKPSDINFKEIFEKLYNKSAYFVMKNTSKLTTKEFEEIKIETGSSEDVESKLIKEHVGQIKVGELTPEKEEKQIKDMIHILSREKDITLKESERSFKFCSKRCKDDFLE